MTHNFSHILIIVAWLCLPVNSFDLQCDFQSTDYDSFRNEYSCIIQVNPTTTVRNVSINNVIGSHQAKKSIDSVTGFSCRDKTMHYIPSNLGELFKNSVGWRIRASGLKEVNKDDLKALTKLRYLNLDANQIQTLDNDVFVHNQLLEVIWLEGNKIKTIESIVFTVLKQLRDLDLEHNVCTSKRVQKPYLADFVKQVKQTCSNTDNEISKIMEQIKTMNDEKLKLISSVENVEKTKNNEISTLEISVENLKARLEVNNVQYQSKLDSCEALNRQLVEKLDETETKFNENVEMLNQFEIEAQLALNKSTEMEKQFEAKVEELQHQMNNVLDMQGMLNESHVNGNQTAAVLKDLQAQLINLTKVEGELRQHSTELEVKLQIQKTNCRNSTQVLENQLQSSSKYVENLKSKINETELKLSTVDAHRVDLVANLENVSTINEKLEADLTELTAELKISQNDYQQLLDLNNQMTNDLSSALELRHDKKSDLLNGNVLMIGGIGLIVILTAVNVIFGIKFYQKKTLIIRPLQEEDSALDSMGMSQQEMNLF